MTNKNINKYKQIKDYYPVVNPHSIEEDTHISVPSEEDIEEAKRWVDETEK
ncbi:MAG: DUF3787 domain-containing protein [Eubacteriales bacterium]|nr:DUF3787 domain-containing protein [Eubacteriales bacterium]